MFSKQRRQHDDTSPSPLDAGDIVSQVGLVYADLNEEDYLVKPRSRLPCSWFTARECFMIAYEAHYLQLPQNVHDSCHHVYPELAFFVDEDLWRDFNTSLAVASRCRSSRLREMGFSELPSAQDEALSRKLIASFGVKGMDRKQIWEGLSQETTCPRQNLLLLAETLTYCGELYRAMFDEWVAYANLIAFQKKKDHDIETNPNTA